MADETPNTETENEEDGPGWERLTQIVNDRVSEEVKKWQDNHSTNSSESKTERKSGFLGKFFGL